MFNLFRIQRTPPVIIKINKYLLYPFGIVDSCISNEGKEKIVYGIPNHSFYTLTHLANLMMLM